VGRSRTIVGTILRKKKNLVGHVLRLERPWAVEVMEGGIFGNRG